jgi:hypothetical protein
MSGSQLEHGEEVCGVLFVARGESSEVLDPVEETLDAIARTVGHRTEAGLPAAVDHRRNIGRSAGGFDLSAQPIGIISLVGLENGVGAQMSEQAATGRSPAWLGCEHQFEGQAARR